MDAPCGDAADVVRLRRARLQQPALAHLLANGDFGGVVLFGSLLAWAVYDRIAVKRRGDAGAPRLAAFTRADAIDLAVGTVLYGAMLVLHPYVIGVAVLGG